MSAVTDYLPSHNTSRLYRFLGATLYGDYRFPTLKCSDSVKVGSTVSPPLQLDHKQTRQPLSMTYIGDNISIAYIDDIVVSLPYQFFYTGSFSAPINYPE